jgi:TolB-like protein/class 3 adenylate cyclase/Tfp pilus assembly protein PilF
MTRKLAAILSADVVGYSRLMGEDEEGTIHTVTVYREVMTTLVQQYRGRVVDSPGDNLLAEFASVVDAVQCAMAIQREIHTRNTALSLQRRMQFRIGINLGDVITEGERIYGDGVNIAARLESLAEAGGVCISGTVYDQITTRLALGCEFLGERVVKNITRPVRVYRVRLAPGSPAPRASEQAGTPAVGAARASAMQEGARRSVARWSWPRSALAVAGLLLILGGGMTVWQRVFYLPSPTRVVPPELAPALALPDKPSIAVLPFVNMSGDPEQEYFSDGMTEDLITELSRLAGLFVIARNSVFTYKGKAVKPDQVSRELGIRYMIEGSVRKAKDRVRITAQLIDATTGFHMWAERYDRDLEDIFTVQEEIARRITRALAVRLTMEEEKQMGRPYTSSHVAWEYFMRGAELYRRYTPKDNVRARELFEKAIDLDPEFARAYASLAATHRQDGSLAWTEDPDTSEELAYRTAQKAVELARRELGPQPSLPFALEQLAYNLLYRKQYQEASDAAKEAVGLNPNYGDGYTVWAQALIYWGKPEEAIGKTKEAIIRSGNNYPFFYDYHLGQAHYVWGFQTEKTDPNASRQYYQDAEQHLWEALRKNKNFRPARSYLVAVLGQLGQHKEAGDQMVILRDAGRPQAYQDLKRFQEYVRRVAAYDDPAIITRLSDLWQAAERP